jgi:hypothetical protein
MPHLRSWRIDMLHYFLVGLYSYRWNWVYHGRIKGSRSPKHSYRYNFCDVETVIKKTKIFIWIISWADIFSKKC